MRKIKMINLLKILSYFKELLILLLITLFIGIVIGGLAFGEELVNVSKLADAIYLAEGGDNTNHPYGILKKYKHTTPRQACINTIISSLSRWDGEGDFVEFLGSTYCPVVGASNDPNGLNKNWVKNVKYFYNKRGSNC